MFAFWSAEVPLLAKTSLQFVSLRFAEQHSSFSFFVTIAGRAVVAHGQVGDGFVLLRVVLFFNVLFEILVQVDAFRLHGAGRVGV